VSKPIVHLTAAAVKAIHAEVLAAHGGAPGIRDETLLESAEATFETEVAVGTCREGGLSD
jgi:prophage maintenance system killer protein